MNEEAIAKRERYAEDLWHFLEFDPSTDPCNPVNSDPLTVVPMRKIIRYVEDGKPMERFETHEEIVRAAWLKGMAEYDAAREAEVAP